MTVSAGPHSGLLGISREMLAPRLPVGAQLGDYTLAEPLWPLRIADAYRGSGPKGPATIYVVHPKIAAVAAVRDQIIAGTRAAAALPEHRHLVRTLAAGLTGEILWIATEEIDGTAVRDLLVKKKQAGTSGFGVRGTGNLISGVANALAEVRHGALTAESVVVSRTGRVRVIDLALGLGTLAAIHAKLIPGTSNIAPEVLAGGGPTGASDVYGIGALVYEALVGSALERGGPKPSDSVNGLNAQIDEIVARACHRDPAKRFGRADVLGEVVGEALNKGGAMMTHAVPLIDLTPGLGAQVSLAAEISTPALPSSSGNMAADRVLAAALADSTEKWLVSKGKLDYGPFSLADVVAQIEKGDITAGDLIMDKDTGARVHVGEHVLLGPMVEAAQQKRDDQRRAQAEVVQQGREKKRGVLLYVLIGAGLLGAAAAAYFIIQTVRGEEPAAKVASVSALDGASLAVKLSPPTKPPPVHHSGGGGHRPSNGGGGGGGGGNGTENLALDMSGDDDDSSATLDMGTVFGVYSKYGGALGGCIQSSGEGSQAHIGIIIDGPSGRVNWVKVNGKQGGALFGCLNRVLRGMKFPAVHGTRTRAEFDIGL